MRASVTVHGNTLYEVQERAHTEFQKFFGEVPYEVTDSSASPGIVIRNGVGDLVSIDWKADYEAVATP